MNNRAYSLLEVKSLDDEKRVIRGVATTPAPDRVNDVIEPLGVQFKNPLPFLFQHDHNRPIGTVKFDKPTTKGITFEATLAMVDEPGTLKERIDEAWQSVKAGLMGGVSIGFRAIEYSFLKDTGGVHFTKTEVYELSLVTIPANAEATITAIKSLDEPFLPALGREDRPVVRVTPAGVAANTKIKANSPKEGTMNVREQLEALKKAREQKSARREEIQQKVIDEQRTKDAAEREEFDTLNDEVKSIDAELKDLEDMERQQISRAKTVEDTTKNGGFRTVSTERLPVQVKNTKKLEPGIAFARYAMCKLAAGARNQMMALQLAKSHYGDDENLVKALEFEASGGRIGDLMQIKANVNAGTTTDATWASPLVYYENFTGDFVDYLRPRTIIGQFGADGVPALNRIPFNVRIAGQTSGGNGYWVGEGAPKPLTKFDFNAQTLGFTKVATIAVLTNDLIRFSSPSAERLVRDGLAAAVIERIDLDFVNPSKAAVAGVSPASITNGIAAIPATGTGTADDVRADIRKLLAPFIAANNPPRQAVYIMDSTTALAVSLMQNPLGQSEFPGLTMNGGTLMGVPVIVSDYITRNSNGGMVILANASDIWLADDGQVTVDASGEASLQMDDSPTNNSATGTEAQVVSMFQTDSTAFRAERYINWARRRTSAVAYLTGVKWGT